MSKIYKKLLSAALAAALVLLLLPAAVPVEANAASQEELDELKSERDALVSQRQQQQAVVNELRQQQASVLVIKQALDERNAYTQWQIQLTEQEIALYDSMIADKEIEVEEARRLENEQLLRYRSRVRAMEENGSYNVIAYLFNSSNLGELLTAVDDIGEIMESDRQLEEDYIEARENTEAVVAEYEEYKADIVEKQDELRAEQDELEKELDEAVQLITDITANLEENAEILAEFQAAEQQAETNVANMVIALEKQRAAEQAAAAIHDAGFQYVLLNSEKALETGENGAARMLSALQSAGVTPLGLRSAAGSSTAKTISIRGISIAALAYTDTLSADSKKAVPDAAARERMVTVFDADQARQDIRAARESGADIVLVAMHWGGANDTAPTAAQRTAAQALCEAGADIIIGAHSNAVQPVEYLSSAQDTAHSTLVAWSMGTLLSASRANREVVSGMLLHLTLTYDMQRRALSIASVQYTPTYCWGQKTDALYKYRVLCSAEEAPNAMIQKQREIMGRALKLIQDTMAKGVAVQR